MQTKFPELKGIVAIDTETYDPDLKSKGPGWAWGNGNIIGVSIATEQGSWYFACGHETGNNCDAMSLFNWLDTELQNADKVVFANGPYDIGWLAHHGVKVHQTPDDVIVMAALLDEQRFSYGIDALGEDYLGEKKEYTNLLAFAERVGMPTDVKKIMPRLKEVPGHIVAEYAEQDAVLTRKLYMTFKDKIFNQALDVVYDMECQLIPMIVEMRMRGVPVDLKAAEILREKMIKKTKEAQAKVDFMAGTSTNVQSGQQIAKVFEKLGLKYPLTDKGRPSFGKEWLATQTHPLCKAILEVRRYEKVRGTFIENAILGHAKKGRIHSQFHATKRDEGGTVSGRGSSSDPNLQQVPARDPVMGPLMRGLFLPEDGDGWRSFDYSQQEPRLTVHYSYLCGLPGAKDAVQYYRFNDSPDYHQMVANMARIERPQAKTINLGLAYGMGVAKLAVNLGVDIKEARKILNQYHENVPFIKGLTDACSNKAENVGFIRTLLGRRCRFERWEPNLSWKQRNELFEQGRSMPAPVDKDEALKRIQDASHDDWYGRSIRRAFTFRAMNRLIQGSAADQTKKAMVEVYKAGHLPTIQIHDELTFTLNSEKAEKEIKAIMENCIKLEVPTKVDMDAGRNWGEAKYGTEVYNRAIAL